MYYNEADKYTGGNMAIFRVKAKTIGNYVGQFYNNKRHGVGVMVLYSPEADRNTIIEGQYNQNSIEGYGRMIFNDGSYY